jgi:O-antigen ligase
MVLLVVLFCVLFAAGGSSRADAPGQVVVQSASLFAIILAILRKPEVPFSSAKPIWLILWSVILLGILQLIPLPPAVWQALPGRTPFLQAASIIGEPQPWRPISLAPGATVNALASLLPPFAALLLICRLKDAERGHLSTMVLCLVAATMLTGLLQFSGLSLTTFVADNGLGEVSGFIANRNHFALMMAIGCVIVPYWAFALRRREGSRLPVALGLILLFILSILASGSRAGLILGVLGLISGLAIARQDIRSSLSRYPRWAFPGAISALIILVAGFALTSFAADRAISINRLLAMDPAQDTRTRALPYVVDMAKTYFPVGTGFGTFSTVYRVHEPLDLLTETYFNHAHNDFLEIVTDGGLLGGLILLGAMLWWLKATFASSGASDKSKSTWSRAGSAIIFLTVIASIADYPARTPIMMVMLVVAATWLGGLHPKRSASLPHSSRRL